MTALVVVVLVVVVGLVLIAGLAVPLAIGSMARDEKGRKAAQENAPAILDGAFDGRPEAVFKVEPRTLPYEAVVLGARARGYSLIGETADSPNGDRKTLVFTKTTAGA